MSLLLKEERVAKCERLAVDVGGGVGSGRGRIVLRNGKRS